jgi:hypothetical protein
LTLVCLFPVLLHRVLLQRIHWLLAGRNRASRRAEQALLPQNLCPLSLCLLLNVLEHGCVVWRQVLEGRWSGRRLNRWLLPLRGRRLRGRGRLRRGRMGWSLLRLDRALYKSLRALKCSLGL